MEIAMLVLAVISTAVAVGSFIVSICVKQETKRISKTINVKSNNTQNINHNKGVVAENINGSVSIHDETSK